MKQHITRQFQQLFLLLLVAASSIGLVSCKENNPIDPGNPGEKPVISSFTATPAAIEIGSSTTLAWSVTGATSIKLDSTTDVTNESEITLFPAETQTFTLTAKNDAGEAKQTVTVSVNNPSDPGAPKNPKALVATPGNPGIIGLDWTSSAGATSYVIERKAEGNFALIAISNVNSHTDAGLFPGASYTYRVRALNGNGARSGWSNFATAIAPGIAPVIARIELIANSSVTTLRPNDTLSFIARAFDENDNDLHFSQGVFTWSSSNLQAATISQIGLLTAGSTQGNTQITATVGGETSNAVTINVALQKNKTLVIYNKKWGSNQQDDWSAYTSAFSGIGVDFLHDRGANSTPTEISIEQIQDYERVFYCSHDDNNLHASTRSLLKLYAQMDGKKLVIMGNSNMISSDQSMLTLFGLKSEGWRNSNSVNSTFTGGAGSAMEGFQFEYSDEFGYFSHLELHATNPGTAAFSGTYAADNKPVITAVQRTLNNGATLFFAGFVLENVQMNLRDDYIKKLMNL